TDGELVYGHDVWMFQLSRDLCFTDEPAGIKGFLRKLFVQALQRDMTQEIAVCGRMNATHAPASQFRKDAQARRSGNPLLLGFFIANAMCTTCGDPLDEVNRLWLPFHLLRHCAATLSQRGHAYHEGK